MEVRTCTCGSGLPRRALYDGHRIFMCFVCDRCEAERTKTFRSDIFTWYKTEEPIEPID